MRKQDWNQERLPEDQLPNQRPSGPPMTPEASSTLRLATNTWQVLALSMPSPGTYQTEVYPVRLSVRFAMCKEKAVCL